MCAGCQTVVFPMVWLLVQHSAAQHALYHFDTQKTNFDTMSSYLRWTQVEKGDVYLATHFLTGCSMGYFGGQFHAEGSHMILFSMWDYGDRDAPGDRPVPNTARPVSPWCSRFSGEGHGAHCGLRYVFELGIEHRFELTKATNASGTLWSASVARVDPIGTETKTFLGTIFLDQRVLPADCSVLHPAASSFQEYFSGDNFYSSAAWRGPYFDGDGGLAPIEVDTDCGPYTLHSNVSSVVPNGPSGPPNVFFQMGGTTEHGCEAAMWRHVPVPTRPGLGAVPLVTKPTATAPTSAQASPYAPRPAAPSRARRYINPTTVAPYFPGAAAASPPQVAQPQQAAQPQPATAAPYVMFTTTTAAGAGASGLGGIGAVFGAVGSCHWWDFTIATLLAASAGFRFTLPVFMLSAVHVWLPEQYPLSPQGAWLGRWEVSALLGCCFLVEMVVDMVPALDHMLHLVLLPAHAASGALVAIAPDYCGGWTTRLPMAVTGVILAILVHSGKAIIRTASSGATMGVLNPCLSSCESIFIVALLVLSLFFPLVAAGALVFFVGLGLYGIKAARDKLVGYAKPGSYDEEDGYSNDPFLEEQQYYQEAARSKRGGGRYAPSAPGCE